MTAIADAVSDADCLDRWIATRDAEAFATLARRHVDGVHAAARRQLAGDPTVADDVTQAVFLVLARRAAQARRSRSLAAWLLVVTRYATANLRRGTRRRAIHERRAATQRPEVTMPTDVTEADELRSLLDDAIAALGDRDRAAIVERYLRGRDVADVARTLGASVAATHKRIERAVAKLRAELVARSAGEGVSSAAMMTALSVPIPAAPAHVVAGAATAGVGSPAAAIFADAALAAMSRAKLVAAATIAVPVALVAALATAAAILLPTSAGTSAAEAPVAATRPATVARPLVATLPGGVTVRLRGLSEPFAAGGPTWWNADGAPSPAAHAAIDWTDGATFLGATGPDVPRLATFTRDLAAVGRAVEFAVDVEGQTDPSMLPGFAIAEVESLGAYPAAAPDDDRYRRGGRPSGAQRTALVVGVPAALRSATLRLRVEAGDVVELARVAAVDGDASVRVGEGTIRFSNFRNGPNGAIVNVDVSRAVVDAYRLHIVAVDASGVTRNSAAVEGNDYARRATLQGVPLASLREVVVTGQPLRYVEFRDVALASGAATTPSVAVLDAPPLVVDRSTPRAAAVTLLRSIDRADGEAMAAVTLAASDDGRRILAAQLRASRAQRALVDVVRDRLGDAATATVRTNVLEMIERTETLPEASIVVAGDRADVPIADGGPQTPMVFVDGGWRLDIVEYSRRCGLSGADEEAEAARSAAADESVTARVRSGEITTIRALAEERTRALTRR